MRSFVTRLAVCALACLGLGACEGTAQLVVGLITNLKVSADLTDVHLDAFRNGVVAGSQTWKISGTRSLPYLLPGSFNWYADRPSAPTVEVVLTGYKGDTIDPNVTRTSIIQLQTSQTLFYRMALVEACVDGQPNAQCSDGYACVEGICRAKIVNAKTLLPYGDSRTGTVECDSGSRFIDTDTCSTGTCLQLPVSPKGCGIDEFCQEGACYAYDTANPRSLEFTEDCSPEHFDTCREPALTCAHTGLVGGGPDPGRCRQKCKVDVDCSRRLPDAVAQSVPADLAVCVPATGVCTFACDPVNAANSGCLSGTRCQVVTDGTKTIAPDCVVASSTGGTVSVGAACNAQHASDDCTGGASCVTRDGSPPQCLKTCFMADAATCPGGTTCHAVQTGTGAAVVVSAKYGVCF